MKGVDSGGHGLNYLFLWRVQCVLVPGRGEGQHSKDAETIEETE